MKNLINYWPEGWRNNLIDAREKAQLSIKSNDWINVWIKDLAKERVNELSLDTTFAITEKKGKVLILLWERYELDSLAELEKLRNDTEKEVVFITPFSLLKTEKWYPTNWNDKILAMVVEEKILTTKQEILEILPDHKVALWDIETDTSDEEFCDLVRKAKDEISAWNANQVLMSRKFSTKFNTSIKAVLNVYWKLLRTEWQYMTFIYNTKEEVFVWASPEKHLEIEEGNSKMNPIAWTLWKWDKEDFYDRLIKFLLDEKEIFELHMVNDETLKMMIKATKYWINEGVSIREAWKVIHTETNLVWSLSDGVTMLEALRVTLYAPTLIWWPLKAACKIIEELEKYSRYHYGWVFWILWENFLDTAIAIRTAVIDKLKNILSVRAWAWIVKDSVPEKEAQETKDKAGGALWALKENSNNFESYLELLTTEELETVEWILKDRNSKVSSFYTESQLNSNLKVPEIEWKKFMLINNWDNFVFLSWLMIEKMWWIVEIVDNSDFDISSVEEYDVVLLWPWPWDINDSSDKKMKKLLDVTKILIDNKVPLLWICLWHQAICKTEWYDIKRQEEITQWVQKDVVINWVENTLAFYNSYSAVIEWDNENVEKFLGDRALTYKKDELISSIQAHPESSMSVDWFEVFKEMILEVVKKD
jgi:phenazine biosynthesis protein phzE